MAKVWWTPWLLLAVAVVAVAFVVSGARDRPSSVRVAGRHETPLPRPPERPPDAVISPVEGRQKGQSGRLIGSAWLIDGDVVEVAPEPPIAWPLALAVPHGPLTISFATATMPTRVGVLFKRSPHGGVALDATEQNCGQRVWEVLGGDRPDCFIDFGDDGETVFVTIDPPSQPGALFVAVEGIWLMPPDAPGFETFPIRQAWWAFALDTTSRQAVPAPVTDPGGA